jgi:site-specific DNA recombinase
LTAEVLGCATFDEAVFLEQVEFIIALPDNAVEYAFTDGHSMRATWTDRSRSESWTEEMRRAAADKTRKRSEKKCQEQ